MTPETLASFQKQFGDKVTLDTYEIEIVTLAVNEGEEPTKEKQERTRPWLRLPWEDAFEACRFAKEGLGFDFLRMVSGIDYGEEIEVAYFLFSYAHKNEVHIKVRVPKEKPALESVESIWPAANWHEREIFDLLGVHFNNHSDLRRILLPDDWEGHPLRKDYREPASYNDMSTTREYLTGMPQLPTLAPEVKKEEA